MAMFYGGVISGTWSAYIETTSITNAATTATVKFDYGIYFNKAHNHETKYDDIVSVSSQSTTPTTFTIPIGKYNKSKGYKLKFGSATFVFNKNKTAYTGYIAISIKHGGTGASWKGTSTPKATFTVSAKSSYTVSYNGNKPSAATATPINVPANQTKWYGESLTLSGTSPKIADKRFGFKNWNTKADGTGTTYYGNTSYTGNAALTLYAQWDKIYPPSLTTDGYEMTGNTSNGNAIKNFTGLTVTCSDLASYNDGTSQKELFALSLVVGSTTVATTSTFTKDGSPDSSGVQHYEDITLTMGKQDYTFAAGTYPVYLLLTDTKLKSTKVTLDNITFVDPKWNVTVEINEPPPQIVLGNGVLDAVYVFNYDPLVNDYELVTGSFPVTIVNDNKWTFQCTFDEKHVSSATVLNPTVQVKVAYKHYDSEEKDSRKAFFSTTRNQNFSNGIYNVMFVAGAQEFPNFTSRVWWCAVNNPLYFPDTNYLEVGSNDTMVMGLTKVGDYLGVVKQSKTTDTAIFLVYPTSFEEETTYAVKQGVQGVGALAKYSFNILGDETLFLSPNGVMAIVPSQDDEHKVQNRSYFIDKRLLSEDKIADAYSFVFDGKYWLAVGGSVYVLDGNQRNSWGNDKTNLVYECYYLENIPANCFVKFSDRLVFSNEKEVCIVRDQYYDDYDVATGDPYPPVRAEWSTIFDDDGALHYYKTMQKKGNLVSILPEETEEERSKTTVEVRKDEKEPVPIERSFGLSSDVPSEMFLKKKFKKYKRLQFIIKNEAPEPFGVDSIIKNYTIGNYAKK